MSKTDLTVSGTEYKSILNLKETEIAIKKIKQFFESCLSERLNLFQVSAPLLVEQRTGVNDNLNGIERAVSFNALDLENDTIEVVQSLAKWKRIALTRYGLESGEGIYTDMNAIRRDEILDNTHSLYVDQWDWEKIITKDQRNLDFLKKEVIKIYSTIKLTEMYISEFHPDLKPVLPENIHFISTQELENLYPESTPKQREDRIAKEHGAVFLMQIGGNLESGQKHDGRSPDYDDWALNGDIILYNPLLQCAFEISSMGIRVDAQAMAKQLKQANLVERRKFEYHRSVLNGELPFTIGGGIGQSRLTMFLLKKLHIGEVQVSVWNEKILNECKEKNIYLL